MDDLKTVSKAVFFLDGDEEGTTYQTSVVEFQDELWSVANWLESPSTNKRIPGQLIRMAKLPHIVRSDGLVQLGTLIPKELGFYPISQTLQLFYAAVDNPALLHMAGPSSLH